MTKKTPTTNNTAVKLIQTKGESSLVEFIQDGMRKRVFVPAYAIIDEQVSEVVLNRGIPYGHPWEEISFTIGGAEFGEAMRNADLWTIEEALKNPKKIRSVLLALSTAHLSEILTIAYGEKKGVNDG